MSKYNLFLPHTETVQLRQHPSPAPPMQSRNHIGLRRSRTWFGTWSAKMFLGQIDPWGRTHWMGWYSMGVSSWMHSLDSCEPKHSKTHPSWLLLGFQKQSLNFDFGEDWLGLIDRPFHATTGTWFQSKRPMRNTHSSRKPYGFTWWKLLTVHYPTHTHTCDAHVRWLLATPDVKPIKSPDNQVVKCFFPWWSWSGTRPEDWKTNIIRSCYCPIQTTNGITKHSGKGIVYTRLVSANPAVWDAPYPLQKRIIPGFIHSACFFLSPLLRLGILLSLGGRNPDGRRFLFGKDVCTNKLWVWKCPSHGHVYDLVNLTVLQSGKLDVE